MVQFEPQFSYKWVLIKTSLLKRADAIAVLDVIANKAVMASMALKVSMAICEA